MNRTLLLAALAACTTTNPTPKSTQLVVTITSPSNVGSAGARLAGSSMGDTVAIDVAAYDEMGEPEDGSGDHADYNNTLGVYTHYLGTLTPYLTGTPLATIQMVHGQATSQSFTLPPVYGPTTIWLDDDSGSGAEFVAGTSPTLWYRDPFTSDLQRPISETSLTALTLSPLEDKNVTINASQFGSNGLLVVTSVYSQGYTLADVNCTGLGTATPSCAGSDYAYMDVFSYSAAQDMAGRYIVEGEVIDGYAGGVSDFDGLTELGFPQTFVNETTPVVNLAFVPPPAVFDPSWLTNPILFERDESGLLEVDNAVVCPLDEDYDTYNEWKIDPINGGANCTGRNVIDVVTAGVLDLDPGTLNGQTLTRIVGSLRPINLSSGNIWIIYPRTMADLTTQ